MVQLTLDLPTELAERLKYEARELGMLWEARTIEILESTVVPAQNLEPGSLGKGLAKLREFLEKVPAVTGLSTSAASEPFWWIKFQIDINDKLAWSVVQEFGSVLNYLSINERLPTLFMPVSPPPYLNGGPDEYLSWVIEAREPFLDAGYIADVLEGRLPRPVEDKQQWLESDDADE